LCRLFAPRHRVFIRRPWGRSPPQPPHRNCFNPTGIASAARHVDRRSTTFFRRNPVSLYCAAASVATFGRFPGPITADAIVPITPSNAALLVAGPDYQTISVAVTAHAVVSVTVATEVIAVTILESVIAVAAPRGQIISVTVTATPSLIVSIVITPCSRGPEHNRTRPTHRACFPVLAFADQAMSQKGLRRQMMYLLAAHSRLRLTRSVNPSPQRAI
jgi:hypothetical protein